MVISTWEWIRATGLTSYLLLFLSIIFGLLLSFKFGHGAIRKYLQLIHQSAGWYSLLFGFFHSFLLYIDHHQPFTIAEIFIPFMAAEHRFIYGMGTISFYVLLFIFVTRDLLKKVGARVWKAFHRLALPIFLLLTIHGIYGGTDTNELWAIIMYISFLSSVFILLFVKLFLIKYKFHKIVK